MLGWTLPSPRVWALWGQAWQGHCACGTVSRHGRFQCWRELPRREKDLLWMVAGKEDSLTWRSPFAPQHRPCAVAPVYDWVAAEGLVGPKPQRLQVTQGTVAFLGPSCCISGLALLQRVLTEKNLCGVCRVALYSCLAFASPRTLFRSKELFPRPRRRETHGCKARPALARLQLAGMVKVLLRGPFLPLPSLLSGGPSQALCSGDVRAFALHHRPPQMAETPGSCLPRPCFERRLPPVGVAGRCMLKIKGERN